MITRDEISIKKDFEECSDPKPYQFSNLIGFRLFTQKEFYFYRSGIEKCLPHSYDYYYHVSIYQKGGSLDISKNQNEHIK